MDVLPDTVHKLLL